MEAGASNALRMDGGVSGVVSTSFQSPASATASLQITSTASRGSRNTQTRRSFRFASIRGSKESETRFSRDINRVLCINLCVMINIRTSAAASPRPKRPIRAPCAPPPSLPGEVLAVVQERGEPSRRGAGGRQERGELLRSPVSAEPRHCGMLVPRLREEKGGPLRFSPIWSDSLGCTHGVIRRSAEKTDNGLNRSEYPNPLPFLFPLRLFAAIPHSVRFSPIHSDSPTSQHGVYPRKRSKGSIPLPFCSPCAFLRPSLIRHDLVGFTRITHNATAPFSGKNHVARPRKCAPNCLTLEHVRVFGSLHTLEQLL